MTSRSSPWAKNAWSKPPEKQSGLPRPLRSLARTSVPLRFKKNDVLGQADPSASRKTTFWDGRTPPLQEKWRFETSVPLRFKKNDVLGQADPSASRKTTIWDERTPPLPYYKAEISKFIAFLFVYRMKRWLQLQKSRQLHWQNSIMQNMERLWTPEKLKKILKAVQGLFLFDGENADNAFLKINLASF